MLVGRERAATEREREREVSSDCHCSDHLRHSFYTRVLPPSRPTACPSNFRLFVCLLVVPRLLLFMRKALLASVFFSSVSRTNLSDIILPFLLDVC